MAVVRSAGITLPSPELAAAQDDQQQQQLDYLASARQAARKYLPTRVVNALGVGTTGPGDSGGLFQISKIVHDRDTH